MKKLVALLLVVGIVITGCSNNVEDQYSEGREKQKAKADKMMEDE